MTIRWKALPWMLGVAMLVVSLVGANRLFEQGEGTPPPAAPEPKTTTLNANGSVTVLGVVYTEAGEIPVGPPTVAALLTVQSILVTEGKSVAAGDPLVQFDDSLLRPKLAQAKAELAAAQEDLTRANAAKVIHPYTLAGQQLVIDTLEFNLKEGRDALKTAKEQFERVLATRRDLVNGKPYTEADKALDRKENFELRKAEVGIKDLEAKLLGEKYKLEALKLTPIEADIRAATAKIERLNATVQEAETAIAACLVRAKVPGVVEQIHAGPGQVFGPTSRTPVLWLIPTGTRIVRAEVEPEFVARIADKTGRKVTITDGSHFSLTYEGTIRRIGTSFLPKRSQLDMLTVTSTRALECVIDIADATPAGKPPLRVGQPVRILIP